MTRAIVWGTLIGAAAIVLALAPVGDAVARLEAARAERAALTVAPRAGGTSLPSDLTVKSPAALEQRVRAQAARDGVLVEALGVRRDGGLIRARLRVSGSADAVMHFADAVERGRPLVRLEQWRIEATGDAVRLQGEAVAAWR